MERTSNLLAAVGALLFVACLAVLFGVPVAGLCLGVLLMASSWALHLQAARVAAVARPKRATD